MSYRPTARTGSTPTRSTLLAAVVVASALIGLLVYQSLASSSWSAASPVDIPPGDPGPVSGLRTYQPQPGEGSEDGAVPDGVTVFDEAHPAVANLDPSLLRSLRRAARDAAADGVAFYVDSGWRSAKYQEELFREAVSKYGSEKQAARWVATPDTSRHVSGDAVDIGPSDATEWLSRYGADYGLCQIYRNEPWHYELRPKAIHVGCPPMYPDPTHDPRMQQ